MTDPIIQLLGYELAGIFAILSLWLIIRASKKHKQTQASATAIVGKLKREKDKRIEHFTSILAEKYALADDALMQTTKDLQEQEQQLYKALLNVFVEQDNTTLRAFPEQLEQLTNSCLELLPIGNNVMQDATEDEINLKQQIEETALKMEFLTAEFRRINAIDTAQNEQQTPPQQDSAEVDIADVDTAEAEDSELEVADEAEVEVAVADEAEVEIAVANDDEIEIATADDIEVAEGNDEGIDLAASDDDDIENAELKPAATSAASVAAL